MFKTIRSVDPLKRHCLVTDTYGLIAVFYKTFGRA